MSSHQRRIRKQDGSRCVEGKRDGRTENRFDRTGEEGEIQYEFLPSAERFFVDKRYVFGIIDARHAG